jgi:hypothetical protein
MLEWYPKIGYELFKFLMHAFESIVSAVEKWLLHNPVSIFCIFNNLRIKMTVFMCMTWLYVYLDTFREIVMLLFLDSEESKK